ncbi:mutator mutT protein [Mariniphaga anaerophila]|uniref:Mutator mutT protein n=1 Tax=Mariniphaga anaerophila TaxID=1484053 RepID=A0A1M5F9H2_9BACT|nr:NUDIX domain-containing protein [Mariniphaga anaerophila]SHF87711.1 mutator mutT protein [Mariniphaga anaerophila]
MQPTHPLRVLKFCPKCGSSALTPCPDLSLKCNDCGFHFYVNSAAAVAALVVNDEGKLLLTKRGVEPDYGKLDLPGGFVDPGETAEEAVKRELMEELGMKVKSMQYVSSAPNEYIFSGISVFTLDMAFLVIPETISGLKAQDDIQEFRFFAENEIDFNQIPAPSINSFVQQFFKR